MVSHYGRLETKKAEEGLATYKLMVASLLSGVFAFDLKGNFTSVNNVIMIYGYKKELLGKSLLKFPSEKIRATDKGASGQPDEWKFRSRRN